MSEPTLRDMSLEALDAIHTEARGASLCMAGEAIAKAISRAYMQGVVDTLTEHGILPLLEGSGVKEQR